MLPAAGSSQYIDLLPDGTVPVWMVSGPYEQPHIGFGTPADFDPVDEATVKPVWDDNWFPQQVSNNGFLDFNDIIGWKVNTSEPEKIWSARAAYASANIISDKAGEATLWFGGNSRIKILLNGELVFMSDSDENAVVDARSVTVQLKEGSNLLLIRTTQSHMNFNIVIFEELSYDWGFFARLESDSQHLKVVHPASRALNAELISTFFYRELNGKLHQRHDVYVTNTQQGQSGSVTLDMKGNHINLDLPEVPMGVSRHELWVPETDSDQRLGLMIRVGDTSRRVGVTLYPRPKYELHLMFLTHTDIGYTHTQPVVREIHMKILDDVVALCESDETFKWTIETIWSLQAYYEGRTSNQFLKLIELIRSGRVAVSPFYTNPFTGMVSAEELIRSFDRANYFAETYQITYDAAVYNDVPGQTWFLPQLLRDQGVSFLVNGLNEVYGDYKLQKAIPKVMYWQGDDGTQILHYRTESYNEAMAYGLERGNSAIEHRMWQRIAKLEAAGYPTNRILLNSAFGDNLGIPMRQWEAHKRWNHEYAWPTFIPATVSSFAQALGDLSGKEIPVVTGDAISDWDIYFQGEPDRMQRYRQTQHNLFAAENLAVISAMQHPDISTMKESIDRAYDMQLQYSGHGSGLEYGYGSDLENERAFDYREAYVSEAFIETLQALERSAYRTMNRQAALEGEFAVVLNPHEVNVDFIAELGLKPAWGEHYGVEDAISGNCIPSVVRDHILRFLAEDIPALGWKKFRLVPACETSKSTELKAGPDYIENGEYRIKADIAVGTIVSVFNKKLNKELWSQENGFASPMLQQGGADKPFTRLVTGGARVQITDDSPVALHMILNRDDSLFPSTRFTLHDGGSSLDIEVAMDLNMLESVEQPHAYSISFPGLTDRKHLYAETVGGFLGGMCDRMPGLGSSAFSIRGVLSVENGAQTLSIASPETRIVFVDEQSIHFNIANNFPGNWNRREPNDRVITSTFSVMLENQPFHHGRAARFGRLTAIKPVVLRGWFTHDPDSFGAMDFKSDNIVLQALRPLGSSIHDGILIRLRNTHTENEETVSVTAPWLDGGTISRSDFAGKHEMKLDSAGGKIEIRLKPNETATLKWIPEP